MDKNNIQVLREDFTVEFHAMAQMHTTAIGTRLEEFTNDQLLLAIDMDKYEREQLRAEIDSVAQTQRKEEASHESMPEQGATRGAEEQRNEDPIRQQEHEHEDSDHRHADQEEASHEPAQQTTMKNEIREA